MRNILSTTDKILQCKQWVEEARLKKPESYSDVVALIKFRVDNFCENYLKAALTLCQETPNEASHVWLLGTAGCLISEKQQTKLSSHE